MKAVKLFFENDAPYPGMLFKKSVLDYIYLTGYSPEAEKALDDRMRWTEDCQDDIDVATRVIHKRHSLFRTFA